MTHYILIDGSWYIFYKYHATRAYFKLKNKSKNIELDDPITNKEFLDDFKTSFIETIKNINDTLKINNSIIIVGKDCKRKNIWRMNLYPKYKSNRTHDPYVGHFFELAYSKLYEEAGVHRFLEHPQLEADDCIALYTKHITDKYPNSKVSIMTADADYIQLIKKNVEIIKPKRGDPYTFISNNMKNTDPEKELFCKILSGDKSDFIPNIFKGCGPKTAEKCYKDKDFFNEKLKNKEIERIYKLNKKIIDMNNIPKDLQKEFYETNLSNKKLKTN